MAWVRVIYTWKTFILWEKHKKKKKTIRKLSVHRVYGERKSGWRTITIAYISSRHQLLVWEHLLQVKVQTCFPWIMVKLQSCHNPWQNSYFLQWNRNWQHAGLTQRLLKSTDVFMWKGLFISFPFKFCPDGMLPPNFSQVRSSVIPHPLLSPLHTLPFFSPFLVWLHNPKQIYIWYIKITLTAEYFW